jgi:hypothetical protein
LPSAGEAPPREWSLASNRRRPDPPKTQSRQIHVQRAGLDLGQVGVRIVGSRSGGLRPKIPVSARAFAKESLEFLEINPQSIPVQKYFQISPSFYAEAPEISRNRVRRPWSTALHVRPCIYSLITFRFPVFAQNPLEVLFSRRKAPGPCFSPRFHVLAPF